MPNPSRTTAADGASAPQHATYTYNTLQPVQHCSATAKPKLALQLSHAANRLQRRSIYCSCASCGVPASVYELLHRMACTASVHSSCALSLRFDVCFALSQSEVSANRHVRRDPINQKRLPTADCRLPTADCRCACSARSSPIDRSITALYSSPCGKAMLQSGIEPNRMACR